MARVCQVTGKAPMVGNNVSHANNKTKRRFLPNLQYRRFWVESENRFVRLRVSNAGLRIIDKKGIDVVLADRDRAPIVRLQQQHAIRTRVVVLHQVEQVVHVAQALRHLLALGVDDEAVMHPVVGEALAQCNGLGPLVLVMRELEVLPTAVQVEAFAEQIEAHHHALAVPAGPALTPR